MTTTATTAIELTLGIVIPSGEGDEEIFYYAPRAPGIARDENGRPQLNVITAGPMAFLQLTGCFGLSRGALDDLRAELAQRLGPKRQTLRLVPAPDTISGVALLIADGKGGFEVLSQGKSSGVPPFHAAFNVTLDEARLAKVREALGGKRGLLALRYDLVRRIPRKSSVTSEGTATTTTKTGNTTGSTTHNTTHNTTTSSSVTARETRDEASTSSVTADAADWRG